MKGEIKYNKKAQQSKCLPVNQESAGQERPRRTGRHHRQKGKSTHKSTLEGCFSKRQEGCTKRRLSSPNIVLKVGMIRGRKAHTGLAVVIAQNIKKNYVDRCSA